MASPENVSRLNRYLSEVNSSDPNIVDKSVEYINDMLIKTSVAAGMLQSSGKIGSPKRKKNKSRIKPPKWHDKDCYDLFKSINNVQVSTLFTCSKRVREGRFIK